MCFFRNLRRFRTRVFRFPVINGALIEGIPRETPLARWDPSVGTALQLKQVICLSCATGQFGTPPRNQLVDPKTAGPGVDVAAFPFGD